MKWLFPALVFLAAALHAGAADWPKWAEQALDSACLDCHEGEDAFVVLDERDLVLRTWGAREGTRRRLVHVLTEDGADASTLLLANNSFRTHSKVRIWIRFPDGSVERYSRDDGTLLGALATNRLDDDELFHLRPPNVVPGSTIAYSIAVRHSADWPHDLFRVQESVPVQTVRIRLEPKGGRSASARATDGVRVVSDTDGGAMIWTVSSLPARAKRESGEDWPPTAMLALDYTSDDEARSFTSWQSMATFFTDAFALPGAGSPGRTADAALVEELGELARKIRYFAVLLDWGGYIPRTPEEIRRRGFGDCKDKTQALRHSLAEAGALSYPVLVMAPSHGYVPEELSSPFLFNHVVTGVPWEGREAGPDMSIIEHETLGPLRLYDPTMPDGSKLDLAIDTLGGAALVLHPSTTTLLRIPENDPARDGWTERLDVTIEEGGAASVVKTVRSSGRYRAALEGELGRPLGRSGLEAREFRILGADDPDLSDLEVDAITEGDDGSWTYRTRFRSPSYLARFGEVRVLELPVLAPVGWLLLSPDEDDGPVDVRYRGTFEDVVAVSHEGLTPLISPETIEVDNAVGSVEQRLTTEEGRTEVYRRLVLKLDEVTTEHVPAIAELQDALRRANAAAVAFER